MSLTFHWAASSLYVFYLALSCKLIRGILPRTELQAHYMYFTLHWAASSLNAFYLALSCKLIGIATTSVSLKVPAHMLQVYLEKKQFQKLYTMKNFYRHWVYAKQDIIKIIDTRAYLAVHLKITNKLILWQLSAFLLLSPSLWIFSVSWRSQFCSAGWEDM